MVMAFPESNNVVPSNSRPSEEERRAENEMTRFMFLEEDCKPHVSQLERTLLAIKEQSVQDLCVSFDCPIVENALSLEWKIKNTKEEKAVSRLVLPRSLTLKVSPISGSFRL